MNRKGFINALLVFFLIAWTGCGGCGDKADEPGADDTEVSGSTTDDNTGDEPQSLGDAMNQAQKAVKDAMGGGEGVEPVDFRKLRDLLPEDLPGMDRTNAEGQKSGMMGINVSQAEGTYEGDGGRITITIIDMGTLKGAAMFGYAWLMAEIDRESDDGYERTTKYKGFPAYEKMDRNGDQEDYSYQVVVGERFIVSFEGDNVTKAKMETARDRVPFGKLDDMKNEGT